MIIRFSIENWMSFRDRATFDMAATREKQHRDRVPKLDKYKFGVLPIAAIYGGNASGKTNLFKALNFARFLVTKGIQPEGLIPVESFRLDANCSEKPSRFCFELLIADSICEFSFALTRKAILEEKLVHITSAGEKTLYDRRNGSINFYGSLKNDQFMDFAFKGTRDNQLFLTNAVSQKVDAFRPIYDWFRDTLDLVAPDSRFEPFEQFLDEEHKLFAPMNEMLMQLDTGIVHLGGEVIPFENIPVPKQMLLKLQEEAKEGATMRILTGPGNDRFVVTRKNGELQAKKLVTYHPNLDGTESKLEMSQESDGSQRVIDLLPAFLMLSAAKSTKVIVIDEVDRSLHTILTRRLLEMYLSSCSPESRAQLLFTTHDVLLMDQDLLRRDEMWVAERNADGVSNLYSFSEYKDVRYDKDIRKSYLQGRLGGIPRLIGSSIPHHPDQREAAK
jgi:AAA15 family ATPase/GTPase